MTALTAYDLVKTVAVELGLASIALSFCYIVPRFRKKADMRLYYEKEFVTSNSPLMWLFKPQEYSRIDGVPTKKMIEKPLNMMTNTAWVFAQGGLFLLVMLLPTFFLLTSRGWELPFQDHLYYNLLLATANAGLGGAHITSYLCVMALALFVLYKTRDVFLGILSAGLLVGLHEAIWMIPYYAAYAQYLTIQMWPNVAKDAFASMPMYLLFIYGFRKYPFNRWKLGQFKIPIILFSIYMVLWFALPHLIDSYYGWLPIRTANIPSSLSTVTSGPYNITKYFNNAYVNALEVGSWFLLFAGLLFVFARTKINN